MAAPSNPVYPSPNAADFGAAVTTSDTTKLAQLTRALYVGGAGDVVVLFADETTATFSSVPAGTILPVRAIRVNSTGTTATNIVALW